MDLKLKHRLEHTDRSVAMSRVLENAIIGEEFFNFICGKFMGYGISRNVFEYLPDPRWVIKIEDGGNNANVLEDHIWQHIQYTKYAKWFAPVKSLSTCGRILLQRKCKTAFPYADYPKKVPAFFTDLKYQNWGMLNGQFVCFDYAVNLLLEEGMTNKMRVAEWWNHNV